MSEWKTYRLGDLCDSISNTYRGKAQNVVLINTSDVLEGKCLNHRKEPNKNLKGQFKKTFQQGDILYSEIRPSNKRFAYIDFDATDYIASTKLMVLRANEKIRPLYLYYILQSQAVIDELQMLAESRSGTFPQITFSELSLLTTELPDIDSQDKIINIFKSLDDKIELNRRINANLEAQAQALFRSWFVDFEPFRDGPFVDSQLGKIPNDFQIIKTGEIPMIITDFVANGSFASLKDNVTILQEKDYAYFIRNVDLKDKKFETYVNKHAYEFLSKSALFGNEIIISNVGDVGSVFLCPKLDRPMTLGNNIIMLRPKESQMLYYLYIWFKWFQGQSLIQGIKSGSAQPKFNKTDFKNLPIILPPRTTLRAFHSIIEPFFNKINFLTHENQTLSALRDTLLPKLIAGEIAIE